jgi:glycerol-3-phosphate acyltransferase PlsY
MRYFLCLLIGYFIGTVNPSYIIAKINGFDIRQRGSRNAGASNAVILLGKSVGLVCAIFDIAKPCIAIAISRLVFPDFKLNFALTGCACILGHILPFYMGFKGGKGLACLGGVILTFDWRVFLVMLACELVVAFVTNYICFVPMTAAVAWPIIYGVISKDIVGTICFVIVGVVILLKHVENIKRIARGGEMHFSYLWNRKRELKRFESTEDN